MAGILLIIACSLDPNGALCQAYGGPCVVLQSGCVSHTPEIKPEDGRTPIIRKRH